MCSETQQHVSESTDCVNCATKRHGSRTHSEKSEVPFVCHARQDDRPPSLVSRGSLRYGRSRDHGQSHPEDIFLARRGACLENCAKTKADDFGLLGCLREGRAEQLSGDAPIVSPRRYLLRSPRSFTRSAHAIRLTGLKPHGLVSPIAEAPPGPIMTGNSPVVWAGADRRLISAFARRRQRCLDIGRMQWRCWLSGPVLDPPRIREQFGSPSFRRRV
jgi:hypothetical protein